MVWNQVTFCIQQSPHLIKRYHWAWIECISEKQLRRQSSKAVTTAQKSSYYSILVHAHYSKVMLKCLYGLFPKLCWHIRLSPTYRSRFKSVNQPAWPMIQRSQQQQACSHWCHGASHHGLASLIPRRPGDGDRMIRRWEGLMVYGKGSKISNSMHPLTTIFLKSYIYLSMDSSHHPFLCLAIATILQLVSSTERKKWLSLNKFCAHIILVLLRTPMHKL